VQKVLKTEEVPLFIIRKFQIIIRMANFCASHKEKLMCYTFIIKNKSPFSLQ